MADNNMTPEQRAFPRRVQALAYCRIGTTCDTVRAILTEAQKTIMAECGIDPADEAHIDAIMAQAFFRIRDEVTQPFRTELMRAIHEKGTD